MTRAAKWTYALVLSLGICGGIAIGFLWTKRTLDFADTVSPMMARAALGNLTDLQYRHANPQRAQSAIVQYIDFLQLMEKASPDHIQETDLAIAYVRLALLADAAHDEGESAHCMQKAHEWYRTATGHDASDSEMKVRIKSLDGFISDFLGPSADR